MTRAGIRTLPFPFLVAIAGVAAVMVTGSAHLPSWPALVVALIYAVVMSDRLRGLLRSQRMSFLPTEIPLVLGLVIAGPSDMLVGTVLGASLIVAVNLQRAPARALFNGFMGIGFFSLGALVFQWIHVRELEDPRTWAAFLAIAVGVEILMELVIAVGHNATTHQWKSDFAGGLRKGPLLVLTNTSFVVIGLLLLRVHPLALVLLLPGLFAFVRAYRAHLRQTDDSRRLGLMNLVSQLTPSSEKPIDRAGLLALIAAAMSADFAAVGVDALEPSRDVWEFGVARSADTMSVLQIGEGVHQLSTRELALMSSPKYATTWRTGLAARLVDGDSSLGWIAIARGSDANPAPFDEIDRRMFGLMATSIAGLLTRGVLISEVAELGEQTTRLRHHGAHDGMTKAVNAQEFRSRLVDAVEHSPGRSALFFLDLDGFKPVNDRHGHAAGDAVLIEVASRLRDCVRAGDIVGRIGGDEFAVIASVSDIVSLNEIADRLLEAVRRPILFNGLTLQVSASIGVTVLGGADPTAALAAADGAMYRAKVEGGSAWRMAEPLPAT